jgi:hypothetical protein
VKVIAPSVRAVGSEETNMRSRIVALATAATIGAFGLILGTAGAAQAATLPPVTEAQCTATGGFVFNIPTKVFFCLYDNGDIAPIVAG